MPSVLGSGRAGCIQEPIICTLTDSVDVPSVSWLVQVEEVKGIMAENIDRMLQRGEKLELLTDKTENLMNEVGRQDRGGGLKDVVGSGSRLEQARGATRVPVRVFGPVQDSRKGLWYL